MATKWSKTKDGELYLTAPDARGYPCPKCQQLFDTNPDEPPYPHTKPNSDEFCLSPEDWYTELEKCP